MQTTYKRASNFWRPFSGHIICAHGQLAPLIPHHSAGMGTLTARGLAETLGITRSIPIPSI